ARRWLLHGALPGALTAARGGVGRGAPLPVGCLPGLFVRAEPRGHAGDEAGGEGRLPAQAGADFPQRARRPRRRLGSWWAVLPDRAPPVPDHAAAEPASRSADRAAVLPGEGCVVQQIGVAAVLPLRAGVPALAGCAAARAGCLSQLG